MDYLDDTVHSELGLPTSINDQNSFIQICPQVSLISNSPTQASLSDDSRLCQVDNLCGLGQYSLFDLILMLSLA